MYQTNVADSLGLNHLGSKITSRTTLQMTSVNIICPYYNVDLNHIGVVNHDSSVLTVMMFNPILSAS